MGRLGLVILFGAAGACATPAPAHRYVVLMPEDNRGATHCPAACGRFVKDGEKATCELAGVHEPLDEALGARSATVCVISSAEAR